MKTDVINGRDLVKMLAAGLASLEKRYKEVDALNVFPVPDGDTGTNMYLTLAAAVTETDKAGDSSSIGSVAEAAARGALMGARGNSGVILSQLLRGIAGGMRDMDRVSGKVFAQALENGVKVAYKAIMKPVEGTILTVAREAAGAAAKAARAKKDMPGILALACSEGEAALNRTPEMLSALREAGVVDAGGMGWLLVLQGFYAGLTQVQPVKEKKHKAPLVITDRTGKPAELINPYCTEVLVNMTAPTAENLEESLRGLGDSLIVADAEGMAKIHIHTANPGRVLETCLRYGPLLQVKVENMDEQIDDREKAQQAPAENAPQKPFGIVAVAAGEGLRNIMSSLGADKVISGGQTMNPSTQELVLAVEGIAAETVIILPNNSNIILTASQVAGLAQKAVTVVPTRTVPQGVAALMSVRPGALARETVEAMEKAAARVKTGEVTYAVRDAKNNGTTIKKGSIIGIYEDEIRRVGTDAGEVAKQLLEDIIGPEDEVVTFYYGESVSSGDAESLLAELEPDFPQVEFDLQYGGQPLYYYLISVE